MRTKDGRELSNSLNVIFIDLIKAKSLEKKIDTNSKLENWAVFLKDADNPRKTDVIHRLTTKEDGLMQAQKSLSSISGMEIRQISLFTGLSEEEIEALR